MIRIYNKKFGKRGYVTLDNLNERNIAKTDLELLLKLHKFPLLIDEVQYALGIFTYIKMHVDKNHESSAFWLTGSQVFKLMRGVQESLAEIVTGLLLIFLSQEEICGGVMESFKINVKVLSTRKDSREETDTRGILEQIYRDSMQVIVSGANSNSQIFLAVI